MTLFRALALALLLLPITHSSLLADQPDGRSLGMAITSPELGDFPSALATAIDAGVTRVPLTFTWRSLEPEQETYDDRNLAIAALVIPAMGVSIDLAITPMLGNELALPRDLKGKPFDDPEVIARYQGLLDHVLSVLSAADVRLVLVGVEADVYLAKDAGAWNAFTTFAAAAAEFIHRQQPGIEVGVQSSTDSRLRTPEKWAPLDDISDIIATSYYPLAGLAVRDPSEIATDFDTLTALYPGRTIRIVETGFPSSRANGSSNDLQAAYIQALFAAWDDHADQILSITIWIEHDYSPHQLEQIQHVSGDQPAAYLSLVGSMGLRLWDDDGPPKPAWIALLQETNARGWQP
jgi:hypothetical protein